MSFYDVIKQEIPDHIINNGGSVVKQHEIERKPVAGKIGPIKDAEKRLIMLTTCS